MREPSTATGRSRSESSVRPAPRAAATEVLVTDTSQVRGPVPADGALEPVAQGRAGLEAEELACAGGVDAAARLPARLRLVPGDPAFEAGHVGDELGELADGDLLA